jgi:hypothetical protein
MSKKFDITSRYERINNLYSILDKYGKQIPFKMNWAQEDFFWNMHNANVILKCRQLGFSTFIQILMLDTCLFTRNVRAGVIAHKKDDAEVIFRDKIKFAYDTLPDDVREAIPLKKNTESELIFENNSSIRVGTSMRSGTLQMLHISEYGKISAMYPEKAREIKTGSFNAIAPGNYIFVESTAEGASGEFYDLYYDALSNDINNLGSMDFKAFFYPWWREPSYSLEGEKWEISDEYNKYFNSLKEEYGIELSMEQKRWYVKKHKQQGHDMKREHPSTDREAFEESLEGTYFADQIMIAASEGRIRKVAYDSNLSVDTFWDIGRGDSAVCWFFQKYGSEYRVIDYYENNNQGTDFYLDMLKLRGYKYGTMVLPHDGHTKSMSASKSVYEWFREAGYQDVVVWGKPVDQADVKRRIDNARSMFHKIWFDKENCDRGITCLRHFRKQWNEKLGRYEEKYLHDWSSDGAISFVLACDFYKNREKNKSIANFKRSSIMRNSLFSKKRKKRRY